MASLTIKPLFYWAKGYIAPALAMSSNAKKNAELVKASMAGGLTFISHLSIKSASDNDFATTGMTNRVWLLFRSPGVSPLTVTVSFAPGGLYTLFAGSIEDECGYSSVRVRCMLFPIGSFSSFGQTRVKSDILYFDKSKQGFQSIQLASYIDTNSDDHSWYSPKFPPTNLKYTYPVKGVIKKGDLIWMNVGFSLWHDLRANDVTVSSKLNLVSTISKITVTAT